MKIEPWTRQQYVDAIIDPGKRKSYQDCLDEMERTGKVYSHIVPHTKIEKMKSNKYKAPRLIQARHMSHNIEVGRFLKPLEIAIKSKFINFAKGNYDSIAKRIEKLASKFKFFTESDHTTFDAHITVEHLKMTHKFYLTCFNQNRTLQKYLKKTINNRIRTRDGTKWTVKGTRMSGDVDTSFGNSLVNYAIIMQVLENLQLKGDAIVNGDDSIIFTDQKINNQLAKTMFDIYNQETEIKESETSIHRVEFCRTKLVYPASGIPTMMMDPQRLNSIYGMTYKIIPPEEYANYLINIKKANESINKNTPIGHYWHTDEEIKHDKHIDYSLKRVITRESINQTSTTEITITMFIAYPTLLEDLAKTTELIKRNLPRKSSPSWFIDHDNKTLQQLND